MAHSSSGDSCNSAPEVIDCFSPDNDKVQETKFLCPLCLKSGITFYCEKCIRNGSFTHSEDRRFERFAEKKLKLFRLLERKGKLLRRYNEALSETKEVENLKLEISSRHQTNRHLKSYIRQVSEKMKFMQRLAESIKRQNEHFNSEKFKLKQKIHLMEKKVDSCRAKLRRDEVRLSDIETSMKQVRRERIEQLVLYIFPISKVKAPKNANREYPDLDDHMEAVYVTGQWELADVTTDCDFQYKVIECLVPANGNYSAYLDWTLKKDNDEMPLTDDDLALKDTAYNIVTALSFTAHLITVLCFFLDAHIPKHLTASEFSNSELSKQLFLHKVAKLNIDVVYLCLLQNVDPAHIRPHHTIENILLLLDPSVSDLGRSGPMEVTQRLPLKVETHLTSGLLPNDEDDDGSGNFDDISGDWVKVKANDTDDEENMVVCEFGTMTDQQQYISQRASITGELMSSMAYLWKAATWQK